MRNKKHLILVTTIVYCYLSKFPFKSNFLLISAYVAFDVGMTSRIPVSSRYVKPHSAFPMDILANRPLIFLDIYENFDKDTY